MRRATLAGTLPGLLGRLPARFGWVLIIAGTLIGTVLTVLAGHEPGLLLGACLLIAVLLAGTAIRPGAVYLLIPAPALAYTAGALAAGYVHDHATAHSRTELAINGLQWIAPGFPVMCVATGVVAALAAARWLLARRGASWR